MKKLTRLIVLLLLLPALAAAQKAYKAVYYRASLNGQKFQLTLGNGYLAASKIKLLTNTRPVIFYPDSSVPDDKDQLTLHAKGHTDYFILNNMEESYTSAPKMVIGRYWTNKRWRILKFVLGR